MKMRDQMDNDVEIPFRSKRIISLVPSQTELLYDLGLEDRIVGVTKFCIHPVEAKSKTIIGGTKNFKFDVIENLQPDLIIGNKEENYEEGILTLKEKYPVWMSDISSIEDSLDMIASVGQITTTQNESDKIIHLIKSEFDKLIPLLNKRVLYLIWKSPWMSAGASTFIDSMISRIGLMNVVIQPRYPELNNEEIVKLNPEMIFLSSEPYPFKEKHIAELHSLVPSAKVVLVDGEMFSWYGSRLIKAPAYFNSLRSQLS